MRGTPWRLPYWPCERRPIDSPASRSSLVSWSESNESATAQRAPPGQLAGRRGRPARTRSTILRQCFSGQAQGGVLLGTFFSRNFPGQFRDQRGLLGDEL